MFLKSHGFDYKKEAFMALACAFAGDTGVFSKTGFYLSYALFAGVILYKPVLLAEGEGSDIPTLADLTI